VLCGRNRVKITLEEKLLNINRYSLFVLIAVWGVILSACGDSEGDKPPELVAPTRAQTTPTATAPPVAAGTGSAAPQVEIVRQARYGTGTADRLIWYPEGEQVAIDGSLGVWDYAPGSPAETLQPRDGWRDLLALSPDGSRALVWDMDGTPHVWDMESGTSLLTLEQADGEQFRNATFSPDGTRLAVAVFQDIPPVADAPVSTIPGLGLVTIRLWDVTASGKLGDFETPDERLLGLTFDAAGRLLAAESTDNFPRVDPDSSSGMMLPSTDFDVRLYDADTGEVVAVLGGAEGPVGNIVFSPDGTLAAANIHDVSWWGRGHVGTVVWDVATGEQVATLEEDEGFGLAGLTFSPDGATLAVSAYQTTPRLDTPPSRVMLWDFESGEEPELLIDDQTAEFGPYVRFSNPIFSPDGSKMAVLSTTGAILVWNIVSGEVVGRLEHFTGPVDSITFGADGATVVFSGGAVITIWDVVEGVEQQTLRAPAGPIDNLMFMTDGTLLGTIWIGDNVIWRWDLASGELLQSTSGGGQSVWVMTVLRPDGTILATTTGDSTISLRDLKTGRNRPIVTPQRVTSLAFTPDGTALAAGNTDGTITFWDPSSRESIFTLNGHDGPVTGLVFSPDGKTLVSVSDHSVITVHEDYLIEQVEAEADNTLRIWDAESQTAITVLVADENWLLAGSVLSPDLALLATPGPPDDPAIRLRDSRTGEVIAVLEEQTGPVRVLAFSPDGQMLAAGGTDGTLRVWWLSRP
jgi:WD40 repeat protein